jgi:hypothetical protein
MAAREDEAETIILTERVGIGGWRRGRFDRSRDLADRGVETGAPAQPVDRFEPPVETERARLAGTVTRP